MLNNHVSDIVDHILIEFWRENNFSKKNIYNPSTTIAKFILSSTTLRLMKLLTIHYFFKQLIEFYICLSL